MTMIRAQVSLPFTPDRNSPTALDPRAGSGTDFASLLEATGNSGPAASLQQSAPTRDAATAVAQVFNAFGFFQAGASSDAAASAISANDQAASELGAVPAQALNEPTAQITTQVAAPGPAQASTSASTPRFPQSGDNAESMAAPERPRSTIAVGLSELGRLGRSPNVPGDFVLPTAGQRGSVKIDFPHDRANRPGPVERPPHDHIPIDHERTRPLPGSHAHETAQERRDRLILRIGNQMVELIARLEGLSEDEEQHLLDALKEVLEHHGLSLGALTLNGRALASGMLRGEG